MTIFFVFGNCVRDIVLNLFIYREQFDWGAMWGMCFKLIDIMCMQAEESTDVDINSIISFKAAAVILMITKIIKLFNC